MATRPCSRCDSRIVGKAGALYWAWFPQPAERRAFRTTVCPACAADLLVPLVGRPAEDRDLCVECGGYPDAPVAVTYLTAFLPGRVQYDDEFRTCEPCAVPFRERVARGGELQPDRGVEVRGPSPSQAAWAAIPIPV